MTDGLPKLKDFSKELGGSFKPIVEDKIGSAPMNPNKALWEKGDFTRIAESMRESGEALVRGLGITKGLKVLDLGCGDGTTALPAAKLGADVLGVDIARNLVEAGNRRAKEQGLTNSGSRKAMRLIWQGYRIRHSTSSSASSAPCSPPSRSMWPRRWCV